MSRAFIGLILSLILLGAAVPTQAQSTTSFDVFLSKNTDEGKTEVFFADVRTGLSSIVATNGQRHILVGNGVLYLESETNTAKIAYSDGRIEPFAAIEVGGADRTVNWIVSPNHQQLAWAVSHPEGASLLSDLFVAAADGSNKKLVVHASSTKGIDTIPLALTNDGGTLFYARQGQEPADYQLFPTATDLYSVDTATGQPTQLPGSSGCACAAAFSADGRLLMRLESTENQQGFTARLWDLSIKVDTEIAAPGLAHLQAGNVLFSPDGTLAIYTSARGVAPAKGSPAEQYVLVLVDMTRRQQRVLTDSLKSNLRPVAFEADNSTVLLTSLDKDGTFKFSLKDGTLLPDSAYTFLGTITG
jgi:hypothetical protein